jgi:NAD(P)-dependent dehydrogenase (short-subunit alcohol dehydrogenase family)
MITFENRVAIITGAGKGLGRAYALHMAERGARVVLNNRKREVDADGLTAVDHLVREIRAKGREAVANYSNVESASSGTEMVEQAMDTWGRLDVLVNNAGIDRAATFAKFDLKDFLEIFEVNFHGSLYVTHAAWARMRAAGYGRVIMSASSAGLHGGRGLSAYSAAKAALIGLMRTLASEGRSNHMLVNAIAPYAATAMTGDHIAPHVRDRLTPDRVAPLVGFLCSERNQSVTGQTFVAGMGRFLRAATVEGLGVSLDDSQLDKDGITDHIAAIQSLQGAREFPDAVSAYLDFIGSEPKQ